MAAPATTLDAIQSNGQGRRIRPPDMAMTDENRVPLKANQRRLEKRESRLGLRAMFNRKTAVDEGEPDRAAPRSLSLKPAGIRASLAEFGGWSQTLHSRRSEGLLQALREVSTPEPSSAGLQSPPPALGHMKSAGAGRPSTSAASKTAWDPPPLFQAYPQSIKTQMLPACPLSVDAITRLQGKESNVLKDNINYSNVDVSSRWDANGEYGLQKKRHRRNASSANFRFDWTKKIYVLVTSGYLLQYAGGGSFDRLPEKMLHLGKDSAAFASDLIPGCHWVLQISAAMEGDGSPSTDSRSLLHRLPFRGHERRHASNMLMVFDGADDMESWIVVLRREIEALGGKKHLSETGKPKSDEEDLHLRAQSSQRTLVVRDPNRFSQAIPQDLRWEDGGLPDLGRGSTDTTAQGTPEQSFDGMSTASGMSLDGRQLENLRDSGAHRLSYISFGQRTYMTSDGSSPGGSPVRDSFVSQTEDFLMPDAPPPEVQLRPNAAVLMERRQSIQTFSGSLDLRLLPGHVSRGLAAAVQQGQGQGQGQGSQAPLITEQIITVVPQTIPNFSIPNSASKRYSLMKSPPVDLVATTQGPPVPLLARAPPGPGRALRRAPPTTLPMVRPLSIVADQPSPSVIDEPLRIPTPEAIESEFERQNLRLGYPPIDGQRSVQLDRDSRPLITVEPPDHNRAPSVVRSRRVSSVAKPPAGLASDVGMELSRETGLPTPGSGPFSSLSGTRASPKRTRSSFELRSGPRSRSPTKGYGSNAPSRTASFYSQDPMGARQPPPVTFTSLPSPPSPLSSTPRAGLGPAGSSVALVDSPPPTPSILPGAGLLGPQSNPPKSPVNRRRSMPHMLLQGPPPAPPPTRSLPPLPTKVT